MELYLVYEFIYNSYDEDRQEEIEFFGIYDNKEQAIKMANKRARKGIKEYNVVFLEDDKIDKKSPFSNRDSVDMYRKGDEIVAPVYSISIKNFKKKGRKYDE